MVLGLGDSGVAFCHLAQIVQVDELHLIAVNLGHSYPLSVGQGLAQHGNGAHLLVVGQIAIDGLGGLVRWGGGKKLAQGVAAALDLLLSHSPLALADGLAQLHFIHW